MAFVASAKGKLALCLALVLMVSPIFAYMTAPLKVRSSISLTANQVKSIPARANESPLFSDISPSESENTPSIDDKEEKTGFAKFISMLKPKSEKDISTKDMLKKMGLSTFLSYGWVSNMSYCICVSLAWFGFNKKTGLSPLAPGQWKPFLAVYAGFYVFNNFVRPFRIALSVGVGKYFDMWITAIQKKTKLNRGLAIGLTVFLFNIVGTCSFMALGISIASALSGVPVFPPKP